MFFPFTCSFSLIVFGAVLAQDLSAASIPKQTAEMPTNFSRQLTFYQLFKTVFGAVVARLFGNTKTNCGNTNALFVTTYFLCICLKKCDARYVKDFYTSLVSEGITGKK